MRLTLSIFLMGFALIGHNLEGKLCGKLDVGPIYAHIDVLESGRTVRKMDLPGIKADGTVVLYKGFCLKPTFMYASNSGELLTAGMGVGQCIPVNPWMTLTPSIGANYTYLRSAFKSKTEFLAPFGELKENFYSTSPYVSLEASFRLVKCWRACFLYQYAWSRTKTKIRKLGSSTGSSRGPNLAVMLEGDFNDHWSAHVGMAYNITLNKENHGLRGYGGKVGVAYWF